MNKTPILSIKDRNGNPIPIPAIKGEKGKSAYEQAKEGGYIGTEEEFIAMLNGLTASEAADHYSDFKNPHKVTAAQTGAVPETYYASDNLDTELQQGGNKITVCNYHSGTLNTPYKEELTVFAHGMVITNAHSNQYGTQLCLPSGEDAVYVRRLNGQGISKWVKISNTEPFETHITEADKHNQATSGGGAIGTGAKTADGAAIGLYAETVDESGNPINAIQLGNGKNTVAGTMQVYNYQLLNSFGIIPSARLPFASGSYRGTGTYGVDKPSSLTFDFVPKFVIVSRRQETNCNSGATFIWINPGTTINFINNGSTYWCHPTLTDTTLSWWCAESSSYQLNSSLYDYDYYAWG